MGLFQDVTATFEKHENASLRMNREELIRLHESGLAIADTETTGLKAGVHGLLEPAVIRAMTISEIKHYNAVAAKNGTPPDQLILDEQQNPSWAGHMGSEIRLIALQHFVLPNRPMIHDSKAGMHIPGSYTTGMQNAYEYAISAYALGVTHTDLPREKGYGPIQGMSVNGAPVKTLPSIVPLMDSFLLFTGTSEVGPKNGVAYFNAPFDIPFLRELFVDVMAYKSAKNNEHCDPLRAVNTRIGKLNLEYDVATPEQRAEIVAHIKKQLLVSGVAQERLQEYFAPARWHCVLQAFRAAQPHLGSHTLDTLMQRAGLSEGERGAHSAIEDVVLTARGMLHLLAEGELGTQGLPSMAELPGAILRRSHGQDATSHAATNGQDVEIKWPKQQVPHAQAVEKWIRSFNRAKPADPREPELSPRVRRSFREFKENSDAFHVVASGAGVRPLFLSFTKHLGVAEQLLDGRYAWLTALEANDRPGSFVDATIEGRNVHDVPWNILRRNVDELAKYPNERAELLEFLSDIGKASDAIGGVLLREVNGTRYLRIYGHVRQHGTVDIPWPKEVSLADAREQVFKHLEAATRLGLVPHASRAELNEYSRAIDEGEEIEQEDEKRQAESLPFSATTLDVLAPREGPRIHLEVTPAMFQLFKAAMPPAERAGTFKNAIDTVKSGRHQRITVSKVTRGEKVYYALDGTPDAFDSYVARKKSDGSYVAIAEKPTNILTDAGWLLDRLQKIPGVPKEVEEVDPATGKTITKDGVEVSSRNRIIIHQPLGIGTDALALMHTANIPYRAEEKQLRCSAGALMQDAFTYSLAISRALKNDSYLRLMEPTSIIPSIAKGLKDKSEKDENHKPLAHVKWDPLLGLQLHYKPHAGSPATIERIAPDKMVERSLPIGRRRVQRVFARLAHLPTKIPSLDGEVRWEVRLTPLEQVIFNHALSQMGANVEWRHTEEDEAYFVIKEKELSTRGSPVFKAMDTLSRQLAKLTEATGVPEWYFGAQPQLVGDRITLQLPEARSALFIRSALPAYEGIQAFLQTLKKDANGFNFDSNLRRIMGDRAGNGGSGIKPIPYSMRRDASAKLENLVTSIERETPTLLALHSHARNIANAITPSTVPAEYDGHRRALSLNQELLSDRSAIAQMIAACDGMAHVEPASSEEWMALRNRATDTADRIACAIHEADRLKEALNTGANAIANDGAQWRSSLIGATVHAALDTLDHDYLAEVHTHTPGLVAGQIRTHTDFLEQFSMRQDPDKHEALLAFYVSNAALRLSVQYATEQDPLKKQEFKQAATAALADAYAFPAEMAAQFLGFYESVADPATDKEACMLAKQMLLEDIPEISDRHFWLPMVLFGKATKADIIAEQRATFAPYIDEKVRKAYHETGLAHLYLAAALSAELQQLPEGSQERAQKQSACDTHKEKMLFCYEKAGKKEESARTTLREKTREALAGGEKFRDALAEKKAYLALEQQGNTVLEYRPAQQERILHACIEQEGGHARLETFYAEHPQLLKKLKRDGVDLPKAIDLDTFDDTLQAISAHHPNFEASRAQRNKAAILKAKDRMVAELDDLGKIESHARRDIEALRLFLQHEAVHLQPRLESIPINANPMHLPEFSGLEKNHIPELRSGAEILDQIALRKARTTLQREVSQPEEIYISKAARSISCPISILGIEPAQLEKLLPKAGAQDTAPRDKDSTHYFLLDTSAVIGYFETLRQHVPRPHDLGTRNFARYHSQLLQRLEKLTLPENHGAMPLRITDHVFYELSGLMPPILHRAANQFKAIETEFAPKLAHSEGEARDRLLKEKARAYQHGIDDLVDWSIRLDRRRPLDQKSTIGDRVEELNQLFTLFAYYPEILLPTRVGQDFFRSVRIESAAVAGIGRLKQPANAIHYQQEIAKIQKGASEQAKQDETGLAHYALSFNDVMQTPGLDFRIDHLRIHWGQMYFMGLIDEYQYRDFMRNISGAKEANEQGHDNNSRFVTYGSLFNRNKETSLTGSGLVQLVKDSREKLEKEGISPEAIRRRNLTFGELQNFIPNELDVRQAIGPSKLTMDQCIFGGLLPGAAIKRHRVGEEHEIRANDVEVESLRLMAQALGYHPPKIHPQDRDRYEHLRNALKHQGFFERTITLGDCARIRQSLHQAQVPTEKLDLLFAHLPQQLREKSSDMVRQKNGDGGIELTAPLERVFTQALVHGVLNTEQFLALLVKMDVGTFTHNNLPACSIKTEGLSLEFRIQPTVNNILGLSADKLAAVIEPHSCKLVIADQTSPHFDRRQDFDALVAMGRSTRRSGANFREGQALLDRLLASKFKANESAPRVMLSKAHEAFAELFGKEDGDTIFFQLLKDFESRQERQFQAGDHIVSSRRPADCPFAANHRNRQVDRRNKGEVSVVEAAHTLQVEKPDSKIWVGNHDSDIVSSKQFALLDPLSEQPKMLHGKPLNAIDLGKQGETPGVRVRPAVAAQHSRHITARAEPLAGDERTHNVPTREILAHLGRLNGVDPLVGTMADDYTDKYAKGSLPFSTRFAR